MVKTYEFHLPMHHIREEEQRSPPELQPTKAHSSTYAMAAPNTVGSRYVGRQGSVYRVTKKRTAGLQQGKRDDISSQMLENETLADQQNSLRNLNLMGSSFVGDRASYRANMSPTAVRDTPAQRRSQNPAAQSLAGLSDEQMGKHHEEPRSAAKVRDGGAGLMSQSIELAN